MEMIDFSKKNKLEKKIDDLEKQLEELKNIVNDMQRTMEKKISDMKSKDLSSEEEAFLS